MNTSLLVIEALNIIKDVEDSKIEEKNIEYIIEEINWSYSFDLPAKAILKDTEELYLPLKDIRNRKDLKIRLQLISLKLVLKNYADKTKELLSNAIKQNHKKDIEGLSDILISSLKALGYSQGIIYFKLNSFFFNSQNPINDINQIDIFLKEFDCESKEYLVITKATNNFLAISKTYSNFEISEIGDLTTYATTSDINEFISTRNTEEVFVKIDKIKALDYHSARKRALKILNKLSDYYSFFHHKKKPTFSDQTLVVEKEINQVHLVLPPTSPMKKGIDNIPRKAAMELDKFLEKADFNSVTIRKIDRALDLHGLSIDSDNYENQILNLWITLEMLIPNDFSSSRIQQITTQLIPFLSINYIYKIIKDLSSSISKWKPLRARYYLNQIPDEVGKSVIEKYTGLIALDEFDMLRNQIYSELNDFPLLRNRIFRTNELLSKPEHILKAIKIHEQKLLWHLRRLYRTRNQIVHDGKQIQNIDVLIENAHYYLDEFLTRIFDLNINGKQIKTLDQGIKETSLRQMKFLKQLESHKSKPIDRLNFRTLILNE